MKPSNVVDNDVVKKKLCVINWLPKSMLLMPSTSGLVTKTQYDADKQGLEKKIEEVNKKIPNTSGLSKKTDYKTKITEIENKMSIATVDDAYCFVNIAASNAEAAEIEIKIIKFINQATKAAQNTKAAKIEKILPGTANV